jgi:hypothetical protein
MAIITTDLLLTGVRRDDVFEWLGDPAHHDAILNGAFDSVSGSGGVYELGLSTLGRKRTMGYKFQSKDDSHGGRRVIIQTTGKRTEGRLNFSLRTMKGSTNTLVTIRMDYSPGGPLGGLVNSSGLAAALESGLQRMLQNLEAAVPRDQ